MSTRILALLFAAAASTLPAAEISVLSHGAVGDGLVDDTVAIQRAIDQAADGDTVRFPAGLTFRVNPATGIRIPSRRTLDLTGATLRIGANVALRSRVLETVPGASDVLILGGEVRGSRTPVAGLQWGIGLRIDSASRVTVRGTRFHDHYFDGIWIGGAGPTPSRDVLLDGVTVTNCRRNGLSVTHAVGVRIRDSEFSWSAGQDPESGINVEPNPDEQVDDLAIFDTVAEGNQKGFYLHAGRGRSGSNYKVIGCRISNNDKYGLIANGMRQFVLMDTTVEAPTGMGISIGEDAGRQASDVTVINNRVSRTPLGLVLAGVQDARVFGNTFTGCRLELRGAGVSGTVAISGNEVTP